MASGPVSSNLSDVEKLKTFVQNRQSDSHAQSRITRNVIPRIETFSREKVWSRLVDCLLTTQQKSGPESAVAKFMENSPFLLTLEICNCAEAEAVVHKTLGMRFQSTAASRPG